MAFLSGKIPAGRQPQFNNLPADVTSAKDWNDVIPGRGDLRISLTSACNLRCSYCHNEGQEAPWLQAKTSAMLGNIEKLLEIAAGYGVKGVKFSGGDPGGYPGFFMLMGAIAGWRERYPGIAKWGMCTNGVPFVDSKKFEALVVSRLDNISIGIDSVERGERSKPSSPVRISGTAPNEIYFNDEQGDTPIKFYEDHYRDLDCGNCRPCLKPQKFSALAGNNLRW